MLGIKFFVQRFLAKRYLSGLPNVVCDLDGSVFATRTDGLHLEFKELAQDLESNVCFVSLCGNYFVKVNNITGLRKIFRYAFSNPKRFSLVHEFANLLRLSSTDLSPQPKAFMVKVGLFGIREILLTEYFKGSLTLQEYLAESPGSRLQAPGSRLQAPGSRLQAPGSRLQAPGDSIRLGLQFVCAKLA